MKHFSTTLFVLALLGPLGVALGQPAFNEHLFKGPRTQTYQRDLISYEGHLGSTTMAGVSDGLIEIGEGLGGSNEQGYIIKTHLDGTLDWGIVYPDFSPRKVVELNQGKIIVVGRHLGTPIVMMLDGGGTITWAREIRQNLFKMQIGRMDTGALVLAGLHEHTLYLMEIDPTGNLVRQKRWDFEDENIQMVLEDLLVEGDEYYLAGYDGQVRGGIVLKFDSQFAPLWSRIYDRTTEPTWKIKSLERIRGDLFCLTNAWDQEGGRGDVLALSKVDPSNGHGHWHKMYPYATKVHAYNSARWDDHLFGAVIINQSPGIVQFEQSGTLVRARKLHTTPRAYGANIARLVDNQLTPTFGFAFSNWLTGGLHVAKVPVTLEHCHSEELDFANFDPQMQEEDLPMVQREPQLQLHNWTPEVTPDITAELVCGTTLGWWFRGEPGQENFLGEVPQMQLYPNPAPAGGELILRTQSEEPVQVQVYSALGQLVINQQLEGPAPRLSLEGIHPGLYRILMTQAGTQTSDWLLIE
ncbi:MAG: T9SS type A sorting domain-containing protein [Bacteroidota bacterium]